MAEDTSARLQRIDDALRTRYHNWIFLDPNTLPTSLLEVLEGRLPHILSAEWPERFDFGGVYVNGIQALTDQPLPCPCKIEYYEPKFDICRANEMYPPFLPQYILHRDEHIAVVYKPAKLPSMPAKEQRYFSVKRSIEELTGTQVHMPSRLDVSTEGILILSLSTQAHAPLQQAFERRMVEKIYAFATHVEPSWSEYLATWRIGRDEHHAVLRRVVEKGGDEATTRFLIRKRASETSDLTVVEARPLTGRTHQIRVHARHLGIPVAGDNFYGGQAASGLHLLSRRISITHPVLKSPLSVVVPEELLPLWARGIDWKE